MSRFLSVAILLTLASAASGAIIESLFFDFGETAQPTPGNYNNVTQAQAPIPNAINDTGAATGITLTITDLFWPGSNQNGTQAPTGDAAQFHPQATRDNLFGNTVAFGGFTEPTAQVALGGLIAGGARTYNFTFFACRMGVTDIRETAYAVSGLNGATAYLNASNNTSSVAVVAGIVPDAGGQILISLSPGPNNNNPTGFYYLGAMRIDVLPEPAAALLVLVGAALRRGRRG